MSQEEACAARNMEVGHAAVFSYTCISDDERGHKKTLYSSLPAKEACGEGYRVDTSGLERMADILCKSSEAPKSCKFEHKAALSHMFRMSDENTEYPFLTDIEIGNHFFVTPAAVIETFCAKHENPEECEREAELTESDYSDLVLTTADLVESMCAKYENPNTCKREAVFITKGHFTLAPD